MPNEPVPFIPSDHDRIVMLEISLKNHIATSSEALLLAREIAEKQHCLFKDTTDKHFSSSNNLLARLDKLTETLASGKELAQVANRLTVLETRQIVWSTVIVLVLSCIGLILKFWKG